MEQPIFIKFYMHTAHCTLHTAHCTLQVKTMKGVGSSGERLQAGPGQWEAVAMDYVDLNDLVPQVRVVGFGVFRMMPFLCFLTMVAWQSLKR